MTEIYVLVSLIIIAIITIAAIMSLKKSHKISNSHEDLLKFDETPEKEIEELQRISYSKALTFVANLEQSRFNTEYFKSLRVCYPQKGMIISPIIFTVDTNKNAILFCNSLGEIQFKDNTIFKEDEIDKIKDYFIKTYNLQKKSEPSDCKMTLRQDWKDFVK